jgi:uncharacterized protein YyaL (SSP411 family)
MAHEKSDDARPTNRLAGETSAYLRQHMHNPVDWFPWGDAALATAKAQDKPLLVSIGYSACHWCHVMERESFENPATAALMNRGFVSVKVDREERPDVDQIYMDTVVRLQGHGGWPLTVFCRPDGSPFYAGTYFPPEPRHGLPSFPQVLEALERAWRERREEIDQTARQVLVALADQPRGVAASLPGAAQLVDAARRIFEGADRERGGFGDGPKFPTPTNLMALLAAAPLAPAPERAAWIGFLSHTCREMARRGLYDQLAGGFHRYCVDGHWGVPHFEKMLYDQGQLLRVYADVWRQTGASDDDLLWPIAETAGWLRREMRAPEGGYYASQDADSEGHEGKFYVWTPAQVEAVLGPERAGAFCQAYAVSAEGNFEQQSVLWDVARAPREHFAPERAELLAARARRVPPATDTKRVLGWNALAISGLAYAGSLQGDEALLDEAVALAEFATERMRDAASARWWRVFAEGRAHVPAFLDDLAALLAALLDLQRAGAGERWLAPALAVANEIATRFFDRDQGDLFLTPSDGETLVHRPRSDHDGATPHSTGLAALGLLRASELCGRGDLRSVAERVLRTHAFVLERAPHGFPTLARAAALAERGLAAAVVIGPANDARTRRLALAARRALAPEEIVLVAERGAALPHIDPSWLAGKEARGERPAAFVCHGTRCSLPVEEPGALMALVESERRDVSG